MRVPSMPSGSRPRRSAALVALLLVALTALIGCGSDTGEASSEGTTRVIQTERGPVTVPAQAKRIVVLSGGLAGYLYALDAPVAATDTRVLGVTNFDGGFPPSWSAKAKEQGTKQLPAGEELNIEAVAAAAPDLIIGGGQGITAVQAEKVYDKLTAIAPTVLVPKTVAAWQEQLRQVADAAGRSDRVEAMMTAYRDKVAKVKSSIKVPAGNYAYLLSLPNNKPYLIPQSAALPALLSELGFAADDVLAKAGNPKLFGSGDAVEISPELLSQVAGAPQVFFIPVGGRSMDQLKQDPVYSNLPSFKNNTLYELPATSYRPDYDGVMATLDVIAKRFA
ncbi:Fe2+-enterobactin ABC transporter substrate-binding protein [Nocardia sp. XZ_19_385]|uniref:Fe2+-enterobactin ABC transporter substrate-binding protein n=1 Tax=Nocardia sp. XZ_19_385 TaxID=2769488 RepID=UPI001E4A238A|nr:ABC transporter substrate-binding protein [Nocardia sp. XZ_19_385]